MFTFHSSLESALAPTLAPSPLIHVYNIISNRSQIDCGSSYYAFIKTFLVCAVIVVPIGMPLTALIKLYFLRPRLEEAAVREEAYFIAARAMLMKQDGDFEWGETVVIVKPGKQHGQQAVVTQPDWNGMVKVEITTGAHSGTTKSYTAEMLERMSAPGAVAAKRASKRPTLGGESRDVSGGSPRNTSETPRGRISQTPRGRVSQMPKLTVMDDRARAVAEREMHDKAISEDPVLQTSALKPLFDDYKRGYAWWWEIADMIRRVSLTCGTLLFERVPIFLLVSKG